jgi:hypothetical protein
MTNNNCLNCGKELTDQFCSGCGQKADTHRISFKNFLFHDVLHGIFHIEKGMLFTAKQALMRPGEAALEYISGKRKRYYNVFYLIVITIGLMLFFRHLDDLFSSGRSEIIEDSSNLNEASKTLDELISQKSKFIIFLFVPFSALNSFILFRRKKLNLSEHSIISGMILLGILLLSTFGNIYFHFSNIFNFNDTIASIVLTAIIISYVGYGYINAFSSDYSRLGIAYRLVLFFALICLETYISLLIVIGFVTNWQFGEVTISPFS